MPQIETQHLYKWNPVFTAINLDICLLHIVLIKQCKEVQQHEKIPSQKKSLLFSVAGLTEGKLPGKNDYKMIVCWSCPFANLSLCLSKKEIEISQTQEDKEVEVLLRNFLDCSTSSCAMPIKFPANLSQITPVQHSCERKGFKKPSLWGHLFFQSYSYFSDLCFE